MCSVRHNHTGMHLVHSSHPCGLDGDDGRDVGFIGDDTNRVSLLLCKELIQNSMRALVDVSFHPFSFKLLSIDKVGDVFTSDLFSYP